MKYTKEQRENRMKMIRKMYDDGASLKEIGRTIGVSDSTISCWLRQEKHPMRSEKKEKSCPNLELLRTMAAQGYTHKEMAEVLRVSMWQVASWKKKHEIASNMSARRERERRRQRKKKCRTCRYRGTIDGMVRCNYILKSEGHHRRGCSVYACDKYVKGKMIKDVCDPKWKHKLIT